MAGEAGRRLACGRHQLDPAFGVPLEGKQLLNGGGGTEGFNTLIIGKKPLEQRANVGIGRGLCGHHSLVKGALGAGIAHDDDAQRRIGGAHWVAGRRSGLRPQAVRPFRQKIDRRLIDLMRPDQWHMPGTRGCNAMQQHAFPWIAAENDFRIRHAEVTARGLLVQRTQVLESHLGIDHQRHGTAAVLAMALCAIGMQPGAGAIFERLFRMVGIHQPRRRLLEKIRIDKTGRERLLFIHELLWLEGQRKATPGVVATQALGSVVETVGVAVFAAGVLFAQELNFSFFAIGADQFSVRAGLVPTIAVGAPSLAIEVQHLGFDLLAAGGLALLHLHGDSFGQH